MRVKLRLGMIVIIVIMLLFSKCKPSSKEYFLSNPTDTAVTVKLDSKEYKLEPQSFQKMKLKAGTHNLQTSTGENVNFIVYYDSEGGIINPTRSSYIIVEMAYGSLTNSTGGILRDSNLIIDGVGYDIPNKVSDNIIIDKNLYEWNYGIDKELPKKVTAVKGQKQVTETKIFTKKQFINFIEEISGEKGYYEANKKDTGQKITSDGKTDSYADAMNIYKGDFTVPDYKTPGMKEVVQKMADLKKQYGNAVKASDQKRIKNEMKKIFKEFDSIHSDMKKRVESDLNLPFYYPYIYFKQGTIVLN